MQSIVRIKFYSIDYNTNYKSFKLDVKISLYGIPYQSVT